MDGVELGAGRRAFDHNQDRQGKSDVLEALSATDCPIHRRSSRSAIVKVE
jgi:hypothetical protein